MKERIDKLLVDYGLANSLPQAQAFILEGLVFANEQRIEKPGTRVDVGLSIRLKKFPPPYVSRGGLKLEKALKVFTPSVENWVCLDIGASTGGFTDCLLQHGAARVFAVDVGNNQLDWKLRSDPRVRSFEEVNARFLGFDLIGAKVDLVTMDLSFISLTLVLPVIPQFTKPGTVIICLVKPQFEVEKGQVEKGGLVTDPEKHIQVVQKIRVAAVGLGFRELGVIESPIEGMEGNKEFLMGLVMD